MSAVFRALVATISTIDSTTAIGRRSILEAAFGSGSAIVIRVLLLGEKSLARRHPTFGVLYNMRSYLPHYFGYCQAVDTVSLAVPKRAEHWLWAMPDGTDTKRLEKFCSLSGTAQMAWLAGPNGALALHSLVKGNGKSAFKEVHPLDYFCNKETVDLFSNFVHRTFVAAGAPSSVIPPSTGFTIASWFDFYKLYLGEALTLDSVKEQVRWIYFGYVRTMSFLTCAENELRMFVNSMQPSTAVLVALAPLDFQGARDMREKISKLADLREHRDHFDWMRPDGPSVPIDANVLPLLSTHINLLALEDQAAASAVKGSGATQDQSPAGAPPGGPLQKKQKKASGGPISNEKSEKQPPGSQRTSAMWVSSTLILVGSWVWNIAKIAKDWEVSLGSRCWATVLSGKMNANKLALCPNYDQHGDMSRPMHALLPGFDPHEQSVRAQYGRAPTQVEIDKVKSQRLSGVMVPKPYAPPNSSSSGRAAGRGPGMSAVWQERVR